MHLTGKQMPEGKDSSTLKQKGSPVVISGDIAAVEAMALQIL